MTQIIKQTHEEKVKMYSKLTKKELASMLAIRDLIEENKTPIYVPITLQPYITQPPFYPTITGTDWTVRPEFLPTYI